jgi:hypothetical protein
VCGAGGFVLPQAIRDKWMHGRRLAEEFGVAPADAILEMFHRLPESRGALMRRLGEGGSEK